MILFLDSSALVKLYITEPGSEEMRKATAQVTRIVVSHLAFAEIHASFARRLREGLLLASELEQLRLRFGSDWERLTQVPIGEKVLSLIPDLCERHPLRGSDAVRRASSRRAWSRDSKKSPAFTK